MARGNRAALLTVLAAALCLAASAQAAFAAGAARLDPARVFNPAAESLFAAIIPGAQALGVGSEAFNIDSAAALPPLAFDLPAPLAPAIARINLLLPAAPEASGAAPLRTASLTLRLPAAPTVASDVTELPLSLATPAESDLSLVSPEMPAIGFSAARSGSVHFGSYEPYVPELQTLTASLSVPVRVGPVHFTENIESSGMQTLQPDAFHALQVCGTTDAAAPCPSLSERSQSFLAQTNLNVRAGNARVALQLGGSLEHLSNASSFFYAPADPDLQTQPLLYYPGIGNIVKHGIDAKVAVPVNERLTVGLQYDAQHYQGDYATSDTTGLDAWKNTYLGNVTYQLPNGSSAITFSARQYRYQDALSPNYSLTQTRAALDFTVKF